MQRLRAQESEPETWDEGREGRRETRVKKGETERLSPPPLPLPRVNLPQAGVWRSRSRERARAALRHPTPAYPIYPHIGVPQTLPTPMLNTYV